MTYQVKLNKKVWLVIIVLLSILSLIIRYNFFTEKFFVDSEMIMSLERDIAITGVLPITYGSYGFAASFYYYLNLFDLDSLLGWNIYILMIFLLINFYLIKDIQLIELKRFLLLITGLLLWDLFAAGITKEVLQSLFFILIYLVIKSKKIKYIWGKILIGFIILCISSLFREYFILVAFFSIFIYLINIRLRKKKRASISIYIWMMFFSILLIILGLLVINMLSPVSYNFIISLRTEYYYSMLMEVGTDSIITSLIPGNSLFIYIINYIITYFRLLIPIELLFKIKIQYIPFVIYQLSLTYYYIKNIFLMGKIDNKKFITLNFFTAYILVSAIMEPDFGSWVRHQTACYSLVLFLLKK